MIKDGFPINVFDFFTAANKNRIKLPQQVFQYLFFKDSRFISFVELIALDCIAENTEASSEKEKNKSVTFFLIRDFFFLNSKHYSSENAKMFVFDEITGISRKISEDLCKILDEFGKWFAIFCPENLFPDFKKEC